MQRRGVGKYETLREGPGLGIADTEARDSVVDHLPAGPQEPRHLRGVGIYLSRADVLDHADARDRIERTVGDLSIVGDPDLDPVLEAGLDDPPSCELRLRGRQGHTDDLDTVVLCRVDREASPATAYVEHALSGLQRELLTHKLELCRLGGLERLRAAGEDRAAIGHRRIEVQREEFVRDVIVVTHRPRVTLTAVPVAALPQLAYGRPRRRHHPASAGGGQGKPSARGASQRRWRPCREE